MKVWIQAANKISATTCHIAENLSSRFTAIFVLGEELKLGSFPGIFLPLESLASSSAGSADSESSCDSSSELAAAASSFSSFMMARVSQH